jgi:NAD(P)-dependent dehydrogenase (short-subunit alcohol dehydrogenase family)
MNNKTTIFITGSSSGLGRAVAKLFAAQRWNVIATMRRLEKETELDNVDGVTKYALDVTNAEQVKSAAEKFGATTDVVLNNAGYGLAGPLEGLTDEQMLREFDTNLMGTVRTTRAFLPYFREKRSGLFINTVSIGGIIALPFNSSYIATKWATEGWSEAMSFELAPFGIGIKTVLPGGMNTDFFGSMEIGHHPAYEEQANRILSAFKDPQNVAGYSTPEQIAEVIYEASTDGKDQLIYVAGDDAREWFRSRREMGDEAFRKDLRSRFFPSLMTAGHGT